MHALKKTRGTAVGKDMHVPILHTCVDPCMARSLLLVGCCGLTIHFAHYVSGTNSDLTAPSQTAMKINGVIRVGSAGARSFGERCAWLARVYVQYSRSPLLKNFHERQELRFPQK